MTPRDREIVRWIGRHRFVTAAQVAERFQVGRSQCYARLTGLVRLGVLRHERVFYGQAGVYLATRSGLDMADAALPPAAVDVRTYVHDLELVSLLGALEREARPGAVVWTERELRVLDTPAGRGPATYEPRYAVPLGVKNQLRLTPSGAPRVHFPDAVIVGEDGSATAIELERTAKGRSRLRAILRAYVTARHLAGVRYFVPSEGVHALLRDEIAKLRADQLIEITRWHAPRALDLPAA